MAHNGSKGFVAFAYGTAYRRKSLPSETATVPKSVHVGKTLVAAGLPQYVRLFSQEGISGQDMAAMSEPKLGAMGIADPEHRRLILRAIEEAKLASR